MRSPIVHGLRTDPIKPPSQPLGVVILGSTGSIGTTTCEIISENSKYFRVVGLVANKSVLLMAKQAEGLKPQKIVLTDETAANELGKILGHKVGSADNEISELVNSPEVDIVVAAMVGSLGLSFIYQALQANKTVLLANKEALVVGGFWISQILKSGKGRIIPIDSEHSAIYQILEGRNLAEVDRLVLTASGGPFLNTLQKDLVNITTKDAIAHPKWSMGAKISVDSATMMNKGLEIIEAWWLFGIDKIETIIHPQSIIHSLVVFKDGSQIAQLSQPSMRVPIGYALMYPHGRLDNMVPYRSLVELGQLTFMELNSNQFPAVDLCRKALNLGTYGPIALNAVNEVCVYRFLNENMRFVDIIPTITEFLSRLEPPELSSIEDAITYDKECRRRLGSSKNTLA